MLKPALYTSLIALGFMLAAPFASANTIQGSDFKIGQWSGSARTRGDSAEFSFCTAQHRFSNGFELSVARSPEGVFLIGLKSDSFKSPTLGAAHAKLAVDNGDLRDQNGVFITSDTMLLALPPNVGMIYSALLASGSQLTIETERGRFQFDLNGFRQVVNALGDCVDRRGNSAAAPQLEAANER